MKLKLKFILFFFILTYILIIKLYINNLKLCIFGLAINISEISIQIFIKSLEQTNYKGTLILFICNNTIVSHIKNSFVLKTVIIENKWPYYSLDNHNFNLQYDYLQSCMIPNFNYKYKWNIYRYGIIYCWIKKYVNKYDFYFLLDVRDTLFQLNLELIKYKNVIYLSEDARFPFKIKDDKCNRNWINDYVKNSFIEYNTPLNSGTVYGSKKIFSVFIQKYVEFIKLKFINTAEQGTLNYLFYSGFFNTIPLLINRNDNGIIYNMGIEVIYKSFFPNDTYKVKDSIIYTYPNFTIPYIVHQYDRDRNYLSIIKKKYKQKK